MRVSRPDTLQSIIEAHKRRIESLERIVTTGVSGGGGGTTYNAGAGLTLTGTTFDVGAGTGITVGANTVSVDTSVIATKSYVDGATYLTGGAGLVRTGATLDVGAGTGITVNANDVAIDTSVVPRLAVANTFTNQMNIDTAAQSELYFKQSGTTKGLIQSDTGTFVIRTGSGQLSLVSTAGKILLDPSTNVDVNSHQIINVTDPSSAQHAATKNYTDGISYITAGSGITKTGSTLAVDTSVIASKSYVDAISYITAGAGLTKTGSTLDIGAGTGITVNANDIAVQYGTGSGTAAQGNDSRIPTQAENDAQAGTTGSPSDTNRYITEGGPRANLPFNANKATGLADGTASSDGVNVGQLLTIANLAGQGFGVKGPVTAVSTAALPAHTRSDDTLIASANGTLSSAFGAAASSFVGGPYIGKFGSVGTGNGQFATSFGPHDLEDEPVSGRIWVTDYGNDRVQEFTSAGTYVTKWGSTGSGNGQFNRPEGVALDSSGNVYITDSNNHRVQKFTSAGTYVSQFGSLGTGNGQFNVPIGIVIDSANNIYVVDSNNARVQKFNSSGVYQSEVTGFIYPTQIAVDSSNNIYVVDYEDNKVYKYNSSLSLQGSFGGLGSDNGKFFNPRGIAVDSAGNIFVGQIGNDNSIQKFNSSFVFQSRFGGHSSYSSSADGYLNTPYGMMIDAADKLYVADSKNYRIQGFTNATTIPSTVLVRHEGSGTHIENGIYQIDKVGSTGSVWQMTRRNDADQQNELHFATTVQALKEGATDGGWFYLSSSDPIVINTSTQTWDRKSTEIVAKSTACEGRLTLVSGTPIPSTDQTGKTSIYFTPYNGNKLALYDGTNWIIYSFTELTLALGTLTSGKNYDIFVYDNAGTLTLEPVAWNTDTARTTAIVLKDGVYVKSGATARRYLGTFRTTSTTTTEDSVLKRFLYNHYNRVPKKLKVVDSTDSWTHAAAAGSWGQARATASNKVEFVIGVDEVLVEATVGALFSNTASTIQVVGVGVDSIASNSAEITPGGWGGWTGGSAYAGNSWCSYKGRLGGIGYHYLAWLENSNFGTGTWYGDVGVTYIQSGLTGSLMC